MPKYKPFPNNAEVMDVLCCIVLGYSRVKNIMKILKQPQSTVSEKLRFLRKQRIITKKKWYFEVNWSRLFDVMYSVIKQELPLGMVVAYLPLEGEKPPKHVENELVMRKKLLALTKNKIKKYITPALLKNMLMGYSFLYLDEVGYEKLSLEEIIDKFLDQLVIEKDSEVKVIDKSFNSNLLELKKLLRFRSRSDEFFFSILTDSTIKEAYEKEVRKNLERITV